MDDKEIITEEVRYGYEGLDTTVSYRLPDELFEDYKLRRKICNYIFKQRLNGAPIHTSRDAMGKGITYIKPND